jgi:hypothetical protein
MRRRGPLSPVSAGGLTSVNAGGAILVPKYITEFADARQARGAGATPLLKPESDMVGKAACIVSSINMAVSTQVAAQGARYEIFLEPDVRKTSTNWMNSAYVVDKKSNQFWICRTRYDFSSKDTTKQNAPDCQAP